MLPIWLSFRHSTCRARHTLVGSENAWWDKVRKRCGMFLGLNRRKKDQLTTISCSVEQLLNNRPLAASSSDTTGLEALTPNHFLLVRSTIDYCNGVFNGAAAAMEKPFGAHSLVMKKIWDRWVKYYLLQLTQIKK